MVCGYTPELNIFLIVSTKILVFLHTAISCSPPNLNVPGADHLKYDCTDSYRLGAVCNLGCKSGYPMGGATKIKCFRDPHAYPPALSWKWSDEALQPFCKGVCV